MSVQQRLVDALQAADRIEASPDLWSRVVHSIEEDRAHRRRVVRSALAVAVVTTGLVVVGWLGMTDGSLGRRVDLRLLELLETIALVAIVAVMGPAIRRFGRGYAEDLWPSSHLTAGALLRLLDVAYALVFAGFILMTADVDFGPSGVLLDEQLQDAAARIGGLLIVMGLLHALTIMALPVVALVFNSTQAGRSLPRWLVVIMVLVATGVGFQLVTVMLGLLFGEGGE